MLEEPVVASAEAGLKVNEGKTKYMCNLQDSKIYIGTRELEKCEEYKYLGQVIAFKNKTNTELERRKSLAWKR